MVFTPQHAPLVVLSFLFSGVVLGCAGLAFVAAFAAGRRNLAMRILGGAALFAGVYGGALITFSATSSEQLLSAGQTKYFCEIDCHVAYSVTGVTTAKTLGEGASAATANGLFYVVTLRSWFDEETTSARRPKDMPLWPNPRTIHAFDDSGRRYATSLAGQKAIVGSTVPVTHQLQPGESYETTLVFDLPEGAQRPRLLMADWDPISTFLIGHENSFRHKKTYFALEPSTSVSKM